MNEWFGYADIHSCAQHIEAKILANKLYARWNKLIDKLGETVNQPEFNARKFDAILLNVNKLETELANVIRGTMKCCAPARHGFTNPFENKNLTDAIQVDNVTP